MMVAKYNNNINNNQQNNNAKQMAQNANQQAPNGQTYYWEVRWYDPSKEFFARCYTYESDYPQNSAKAIFNRMDALLFATQMRNKGCKHVTVKKQE